MAKGSTEEQDQSLASPSRSTQSSTYKAKVLNGRIICLYALDWLIVLAALAVSQVITIPWSGTTRFFATDPEIQSKDSQNSTSFNRVVVVLTSSTPVVTMVIWLGYFKRPLIEFHSAILGLAQAMCFSMLFTSIFKQIGMILGPNFVDRCKPSFDAIQRSMATGVPLTFKDCTTTDTGAIKQASRAYPSVAVVLASCSGGYLALFASMHLGLRLHPSVRARLTPADYPLRPGQNLVSFLCLLPLVAGLVVPALQTSYAGGGRGWGNACSAILGYVFALWGHVIYVATFPPTIIVRTAVHSNHRSPASA
ncbi:hypothetical protein GGI12_000238 [Dipsacomyces acuminosporus]|nr:hypothetical protein GGI12_000238 [Dipsacomyces acuminosporus]